MKRAIAIVLMASVCFGANAQNVLKGLGDKAKQKVEKSVQKKIDQKIDNAIDGAVDRLFGGSGNKNNDNSADNGNAGQSTGSSVGTGNGNAASYNYAQDLLSDSYSHPEWDGDEDELPVTKVNTLKELLALRPEIPSAAELVTVDGAKAFDKAVKTSTKSANMFIAQNMTRMSSYSAAANRYANYDDNAKLEALYEELSSIQQADVDMAIARQQAAATNMLGVLTGTGNASLEDGTIEGALATQQMRMLKGWSKSEECKKVNQMEQELDAKLQDWFKKGRKNYDDPYPIWWTEGRKAQNKVIDAYNEKQMKKWIETVKRFELQDQASINRIVEIEGELAAMGDSDKSNPMWSRCMVSILQMYNKIAGYMLYPSKALECPLVEHTSEN